MRVQARGMGYDVSGSGSAARPVARLAWGVGGRARVRFGGQVAAPPAARLVNLAVNKSAHRAVTELGRVNLGDDGRPFEGRFGGQGHPSIPPASTFLWWWHHKKLNCENWNQTDDTRLKKFGWKIDNQLRTKLD